ncbi:FAD-dependent thymidylate synthase [Megamonas funiformis]|uniref:FAD-dependent thymidylate synthase n=1 Tax=Megamonas funiformis TaxID=437897 RepID=UPI003F5C5487
MKCKLISHTPEPEKVVSIAAKLCYSKSDVDGLITGVLTGNDTEKFIDKLKGMGHESPLEHVSFTFAIEGVSRTLTHQLVRHRIASYSQKSQRYVSENNFEYIVPPSIARDSQAKEKFENLMCTIRQAYNELASMDIPKEDARYVLPNATETKIIVTMNARSLFNFFSLRCCTHAQWEIRQLANLMLAEVQKVAPILFKNAGASCKKGYCPEEGRSCGNAPTLSFLKEYGNMLNLNEVFKY